MALNVTICFDNNVDEFCKQFGGKWKKKKKKKIKTRKIQLITKTGGTDFYPAKFSGAAIRDLYTSENLGVFQNSFTVKKKKQT